MLHAVEYLSASSHLAGAQKSTSGTIRPLPCSSEGLRVFEPDF
jgi:hypothetical protein